MSISRFYSLGLSKYDNFVTNTAGLIVAGDSSPSVALYSLLYMASAGALEIDTFDDGEEGQVVIVQNVNSGNVSFTNTYMATVNSGAIAQGGNIGFIKRGTKWYELFRNSGTTKGVVGGGRSGFGETLLLTGTDPTPSVAGGVKAVVFNSCATVSITDFDDGYDGQILHCVNLSGKVEIDDATGKILIGSSGQKLSLATSQGATFMMYSGAWHLTGVSDNLNG